MNEVIIAVLILLVPIIYYNAIKAVALYGVRGSYHHTISYLEKLTIISDSEESLGYPNTENMEVIRTYRTSELGRLDDLVKYLNKEITINALVFVLALISAIAIMSSIAH